MNDDNAAEGRLIARLDQFASLTREVAHSVALYFNQLIEDGVPADIAGMLTAEYMQLVPFGELLGS